MTIDTERGFTVIEVMLFLAITGGLFAALMIGVGIGISQQHYLDSVRSYKALLQNQYSEVVNTRNEDVDDWKCGGSGTIESATSRDPKRGASQCVILGRVIVVNGNKITTSSVTGYDPTGTTQDNDGDGTDDGQQVSSTDDIIVLTKYYQAKQAAFDKQEDEVDWGSYLATAPNGGDRSSSKAVIIIVKSPATGLVRTFVSQDTGSALGTNNDLTTFITAAASTTPLSNCVENDYTGLLPKQMVTINPRVSGSDGVTLDGGQNEVCQ